MRDMSAVCKRCGLRYVKLVYIGRKCWKCEVCGFKWVYVSSNRIKYRVNYGEWYEVPMGCLMVLDFSELDAQEEA